MHKKSIYTLCLAFAALTFCTGCDNGLIPTEPKQGAFALTLAVGEVQSEVITRNALSVDVTTFLVNLTDADGNYMMENKVFGTLTETDCILPSGNGYQLKVESCTPKEAVALNNGWGMAHFIGTTTFDIVSNQQTSVSLMCSMDNAGIQFVFDPSFLDKFPIHAVTTQDSRSLVFNEDTQEQIAYYPIGEGGVTVRFKLTGSAGGWSDRLDITQELELSKGKIYTVNVTYNDNRVRCEKK